MASLIRQPINEEYEWLQYNTDLRVIHSIKDDMYQAQSIVRALNEKKEIYHWLENKITKDLIQGIKEEEGITKIYERRTDVQNELRGIYVHRLLVNSVAMWASPKYAVKIAKLLDRFAQMEREAMEKKLMRIANRQKIKIESLEEELAEKTETEFEHEIEMDEKKKELKEINDELEEKQAELECTLAELQDAKEELEETKEELAKTKQEINELKPRVVPKGMEETYVWAIYVDDPDEEDDDEYAFVHFIKRHHSTINRALKGVRDDQIIFRKDNLPVAIPANTRFKELATAELGKRDFIKHHGSALVKRSRLDDLVAIAEDIITNWKK